MPTAAFASPVIPSTSTTGSTRAYLASFQSDPARPFWRGFLKAYQRDANGQVPVDSNGVPLASALVWDAGQQLTGKSSGSRTIFTAVNGRKEDFTNHPSLRAFDGFKLCYLQAGQPGRTTVLIAGANDGMLHAFRESDGEELWAFIPPNLLGRLKELVKALTNSAEHPFSVDSNPIAADFPLLPRDRPTRIPHPLSPSLAYPLSH